MDSDTIESEWSQLAQKDGSIVLQQPSHSVIIGGDNAQKITSQIGSVSFSPSINKAKTLQIQVPPDEKLEDLTYLGEPLEFYVDGDLAFRGKVKEIQTSQKEGEDYSIKAEPPGKRLSGSIIERDADNEIVSDSASLLVDRFNEYDGEHKTAIDNSILDGVESIGGGVYRAEESSGTITFENVGPDASDIDAVNVKLYTPSTSDATVTIKTESSSYHETLSDLDKNIYGEWGYINPENLNSEVYDIEIELIQDSLLINWISITDQKLRRETEAPDVSTLEEGSNFYSRSGDEISNSVERVGEGVVAEENEPLRTRQVSSWATSGFGNEIGSNEDQGEGFIDGTAQRIEPYATDVSYTSSNFTNIEDTLEDWSLWARTFTYEYFVDRSSEHHNSDTYYDRDWSGDYNFVTTPVYVEDESVEITGSATKRSTYDYHRDDASDDMRFTGAVYLNDNQAEVRLQAGPFQDENNEDGYGFELDDSQLILNRYDDGSSEQLDSTAVTLPNDEYVEFVIRIEPIGEDNVNVQVSHGADTWSVSQNDSTHKAIAEFYASRSSTGSIYVDDLFGRYEHGGLFEEIRRHTEVTIFEESLEFSYSAATNEYRTWGWERIAAQDYMSEWDQDLDSPPSEVSIRAVEDRDVSAFIISGLAYLHRGRDLWDEETHFDTQLHEPEGHLDKPYIYAWDELLDTTVDLKHEEAEDNITRSVVDGNMSNYQDAVSEWGIRQTTDITLPFPESFSNDTTVENDYAYPGVSHKSSFALPSGGAERNDETPRYGYLPMEVDSFTVTADYNNLEVIFNESFSDNRLAEMNSIANDSSLLFRWEGDLARIFHRGQRETDIALRSENVESSVSIEDVYRSCEVIGVHNVRSGVVESTDVPEFVDEHKQIRSEDVRSKPDAVNRARRFLEDHGAIKFKGTIQTLPTFAPLGEMVDGSLFNHGQDMVIRSVRYRKDRTTITLGLEKDVGGQIISLSSDTGSTKSRTTSKGMTVPVGEDQI